MKVIITGTTGMVGEGVLMEALNDTRITEILVVARRASGYVHQKLTELLIPDFFNLSDLKGKLTGVDGCFFCLGISSVGVDKSTYEKMTYDLTMHFAQTLVQESPQASFFYISGAGTDATGKSKMHWARVKGKTENDLRTLGFAKVYAMRPGMMKPTENQKFALKFYQYFRWLFPILERWGKKSYCTLTTVGSCMINLTELRNGPDTLEVLDIRKYGA